MKPVLPTNNSIMKTTLKSLIKSLRLDWVNSDINSKNFPTQNIRSADYKLFHFDRYISSDDAEKEIEKEGYLPVNLYELLAWKDWNAIDWVIALGSSCEVDGGVRVPFLSRFDVERGLGLDWRGYGWSGYCRFLAVRTLSLEPEKSALIPSDTLTLPDELQKLIDSCKEHGYTVCKIM